MERAGGHAPDTGFGKASKPEPHDTNSLYASKPREADRRIDACCLKNCDPPTLFLLTLDEYQRRVEIPATVGLNDAEWRRGTLSSIVGTHDGGAYAGIALEESHQIPQVA